VNEKYLQKCYKKVTENFVNSKIVHTFAVWLQNGYAFWPQEIIGYPSGKPDNKNI